MSLILPTPLLLFAAVVAAVPLTHLWHRPVSLPHLMAVTFPTTLGVIVAFWLGWVASWLMEQRW